MRTLAQAQAISMNRLRALAMDHDFRKGFGFGVIIGLVMMWGPF